MGGVVDNSPLLQFMLHILAEFPEGFKRRITLSAVNANNGEYTDFTQDNMAFSEVAFAAKSSSSIPFVFPPHIWPDRGVFVDGMTGWNINTTSGVEQCRELVDNDSDIIVDVYIIGDNEKAAPIVESDDSTFENYMR